MLFNTNIKNPGLSIKRLECNYKNLSQRFTHVKKDYSKQFAHIYAIRLSLMREVLVARVGKKWGNEFPIRRLFELKEEDREKCVIIGTLFKHQELKPSILKELSDENNLVPQPPRFHFVDDADKLILEDELQRIRLVGNVDVHRNLTGVVCAVMGYQEGDGRFSVDLILFAESGVQRPLPQTEASTGGLLVMMSGLALASSEYYHLSLQLLVEWISGALGTHENIAEAARVVRVIIAGNSVRSSNEIKQRSLNTRSDESQDTLEAVKSVDDLLQGLCSAVPVDIMGGEFDPCNHMLPQQPLHPCLFPKARATRSLQGVTNPYQCEIDGCSILGSSGQPIQDVLRYSCIDSPIEALKSSLQWAHLAPTAPDTLSTYPYYENDPFIMTEAPHIYFVGNCNEFQTDLHTGPDGQQTRLVCIPEFYRTQTVVVVDLGTLECTSLSFAVED